MSGRPVSGQTLSNHAPRSVFGELWSVPHYILDFAGNRQGHRSSGKYSKYEAPEERSVVADRSRTVITHVRRVGLAFDMLNWNEGSDGNVQ